MGPHRMSIDQILRRLGQEIGLPKLGLDETQLCTLRFDNKNIIAIEVSSDERHAHLYSMVFTIPTTDKAAFYERLLNANLFGKETGMASFSCNPNTGEVFLIRTLTVEGLTYEHFATALEELLQCIEYWCEQYKQGQLLSGTELSHTSPPETRDQHPLDSQFV